MAAKPYIQNLLLTNFRSYRSLDIQLGSQPVVLFGENGAGKTNLLEAISLLSPGRGLRRAKLIDIALRDQTQGTTAPHWGIAAELASTGSKQKGQSDVLKIGTGQMPSAPTRRLIRINGENTSGTELAKCLTLNWLTPAQDRLFAGPATERRKFLDRLCLVHAPEHGRTTLIYEKARSERGRLLTDGIQDAYWFDALEQDMAQRGAAIAHARWQTINKLQAEIDARPEGAFPKASLALGGEAEALYQAGADEEDVAEFIKAALQTDRPIDRRAGRTLRGVHKSDLCVTHTQKNMPASECSTGEQKALLIGLTLAHARAQSAQSPLLLLDEAAAHLDSARRGALIENLLELNTQVFLTGTDANLFSAFKDRAQMFKVHAGQLELQ